MVAKKDFNAPKHEDLEVPNLEVIKAMQSLTSKGLVKTQFSWQWYYYVLTPEGVEYLREWCVDWRRGCVSCADVCVGCTFPTKSCLLRISVRRVLRVQLRFAPVLERVVLLVLLAATRKVTGERRVAHLATSGHPLLVLVGVGLESKWLLMISRLGGWSPLAVPFPSPLKNVCMSMSHV